MRTLHTPFQGGYTIFNLSNSAHGSPLSTFMITPVSNIFVVAILIDMKCCPTEVSPSLCLPVIDNTRDNSDSCMVRSEARVHAARGHWEGHFSVLTCLEIVR